MKRIYLLIALTIAVGGVQAQDLDTVTITDQFNVGTDRGNQLGNRKTDASYFGQAMTDGSDFADYLGTDATANPTTSIRYINTWAGTAFTGTTVTDRMGTPAVESPIVDVSSGSFENPDWTGGNMIETTPNTLTGATGGSTVVSIGDDGGHNGLFFGDSNDKNYYVEVDVYCPQKPAEPAAALELIGVGIRAGRDNDPATPAAENGNEWSYNVHLNNSYAMHYDVQMKTIVACRFTTASTSALINARNWEAIYQQYGTTVTLPSAGWHRFRIEANNSTVQFKLDGTEIATVVDPNPVVSGRAGLFYVERSVSTTNETQGQFDNLKAGPATLSAIREWTLY